MNIVVKIGGSVVFDDSGPRTDYIRRLFCVLREVRKSHKLSVAIGGGRFVKNYMERLGDFTRNEKEKVAIELLRGNVMLFSIALRMKPCFSEKDAAWNSVIGGIRPGQSTD